MKRTNGVERMNNKKTKRANGTITIVAPTAITKNGERKVTMTGERRVTMIKERNITATGKNIIMTDIEPSNGDINHLNCNVIENTGDINPLNAYATLIKMLQVEVDESDDPHGVFFSICVPLVNLLKGIGCHLNVCHLCTHIEKKGSNEDKWRICIICKKDTCSKCFNNKCTDISSTEDIV